MWSSSKRLQTGSCLVLLLIGLPGLVAAQELEISSSPTPVGSGARAAGMADAFVAVADDATAASWNPAGLVQLERPEISVVGAYNYLMESFGADYHDEFDSRHHADKLALNYLSLAWPLPVTLLGRNVCLSLNYQQKYDFNRAFSFDFNRSSAVGALVNDFMHFDFVQKGGLSTITPAAAIEITRRLSIGAAFNFWQPTFLSDNSWEQTVKGRSTTFAGATIALSGYYTKERYEDFTGQNMTLGLLWSPLDRLSIGVRYDTAFSGKADYRRSELYGLMYLSSGMISMTPETVRERREVHFPDSLALGVAWRANDKFTLSMDVTRTDWNDFYVKTGDGERRSLVDFSNLENAWTRTRFDPTYTVRLGWEYVFLPKEPEEKLGRLWTLRGGVFLDQEPATGKSDGFRWPGDNGNGKPENFYGCALGVGVQLGQRVNLDAAWQLRYGPGVNNDLIRGVSGFEEDVIQQRFLLSTVIYF
jgi:long-subunit fatty acid transport protein